MLAVIVDFEAQPGQGDALREALQMQARNSLEKEDGCRHFDVCADRENSERFLLYELYDDEAAFAAHRETPHFAAFHERIRPILKDRVLRTMTRL